MLNENNRSILGIRGRLLLGFASVAVILLIAIACILAVVRTTQSYAQDVVQINLPEYDRIYDLGLQLTEAQAAIRGWLLTGDSYFKADFERNWDNISRIETTIDGLLKVDTTSQLAKNWDQIKGMLAQLKSSQYRLEAVSSTNITKSTLLPVSDLENKLLSILDGPINGVGERVGGLYDVQYDAVTSGAANILNDLATIKIIEYLLMFIIIVVSTIVAFITARSILNPLSDAIAIAENIASGKKDNRITITSNDETGVLLNALAKMQDAIKDNEVKLMESEAHTKQLLDTIVATAEDFSLHSSKVAAGDLRPRLNIKRDNVMAQLGNDLNTMTESLAGITTQITQASQNMMITLDEVKSAVAMQSAGASQQASAINEITASLDEIEQSSNQTLEKAKALGDIAERTKEKGVEGLSAIEQSIEGMKVIRDKVQMIAQTILDLSNQTQQIGDITALVNTLAQQSKMLALNASIEAAKAGDAGKGFAVVAAEVKNLAEQSEQSTAQVQKILEDIRHATEKAVLVTEEGTKGVDQGTTLVMQTGDIVRSLSDVINEATIASQQIEVAVRQEGVGIEQITSGMNEINQVTSSFVASAKQTLEAIGNLTDITAKLKDQIDSYKT